METKRFVWQTTHNTFCLLNHLSSFTLSESFFFLSLNTLLLKQIITIYLSLAHARIRTRTHTHTHTCSNTHTLTFFSLSQTNVISHINALYLKLTLIFLHHTHTQTHVRGILFLKS